MDKLVLGALSCVLPDRATVQQGMVTITLPSANPRVRPNIILTLEELQAANLDLDRYFARALSSVEQVGARELWRGPMSVDGVPARAVIVEWPLARIQPGTPGWVTQLGVAAIRDRQALLITASVPREQRDDYFGGVLAFVRSFRWAGSLEVGRFAS